VKDCKKNIVLNGNDFIDFQKKIVR
jgi:hypothetical protein